MLISLNWLRDYVDIDVDPAQLADDLTMLGLNVEGLEHRPNPFADLRIGKVLTCGKHPNADKLSVCTVDIGEERPRDIVCGAPNVREGLEVAVIPAGACLPDGTPIKKGKIRGALSTGMICSAIELGLGSDADGIMELDYGSAPGTPLSDHFGEEDWIVDIEVTPNRPDQLGYLGIAREVAALYDTELRMPDIEIPAESLAEMDPVSVKIEDADGCPRYVARRLTDVSVQGSPEWLCRRLEAIGLRPLNNVVDVTNYVLFETGHPLHAFDADKLAGGGIVVRRARAKETTVTLDGKPLTLDAEDLVIADAESTIAVAGVMGGEGSKVEESSREIVLESAQFDSRTVRATRRRHDLASDSSYRFERGASFDMAAFASARAAKLLVEIAGAKASAGVDDVVAQMPATSEIALRREKVNGLMGTDLTLAEIGNLLARFAIPGEPEGELLRVAVPEFRRDLLAEVDLIEEVARLYGYNAVPTENRVRNSLYGALSDEERAEERLHATLTGLGCQEVLTSSFMDERHLDDMGLVAEDPRRGIVTLLNPLVSFNSKLRSSLLPGMLEVLKTNFHRGHEELRLYQFGRVYLRREGEPLPDEPRQLALLMTGHLNPAHWASDDIALGLSDLAGFAAAIGRDLGDELRFDYGGADPFFSGEQSFRLVVGDEVVGQGGLLRSSLLSGLKQKREVFFLEFFRPLGKGRRSAYSPLPPYPASRRDLALLVPDGVRWEDVEACIVKSGGKWLESCELFDVYRGEGVGEGESSCAVRLTFRSSDATLTDKQVDKQLRRVLDQLNKTLKVALRS